MVTSRSALACALWLCISVAPCSASAPPEDDVPMDLVSQSATFDVTGWMRALGVRAFLRGGTGHHYVDAENLKIAAGFTSYFWVGFFRGQVEIDYVLDTPTKQLTTRVVAIIPKVIRNVNNYINNCSYTVFKELPPPFVAVPLLRDFLHHLHPTGRDQGFRQFKISGGTVVDNMTIDAETMLDLDADQLVRSKQIGVNVTMADGNYGKAFLDFTGTSAQKGMPDASKFERPSLWGCTKREPDGVQLTADGIVSTIAGMLAPMLAGAQQAAQLEDVVVV